MNEVDLGKPIGDMTLEALQEHLRPVIREMLIEAVVDARHREEGFIARYDKPTEVLISTMSVKIDEMGEDIVEIKQRLSRLEDRVEEHRRENEQEFKAVRQEMNAGFTALRQMLDEHKQENEREFKALRQEIHQEVLELHKALSRQLRWIMGTMIGVGGLIVAVVAFFR